MIHKLNQLKYRMTYAESQKHKTCEKHFGQMKLLMTEIHFLSKYYKNGMLVLYVGAASGYHIKKIMELFPKIEFDLYDPLKFDIQPSNKIKIFNQFFGDDDAKKYSNMKRDIIFITDIRGEPQNMKESDEGYEAEFEKIVNEDMKRQLRWTRIIKPVASSFKFRLPFTGKMDYLDGDVWLQSYSPASTEMRLFTSDYNKMITYDCKEVDEKLAYFNCHERCDRSKKWENAMKKYEIKNHWDNAYCLDIISFYLRKIRNKKIISEEECSKIFIDIIKFFTKRYGNKYLQLLNSW